MSDQQLEEELHETIIRKPKKRKVQSPFIDYIWGADLADMQLISKFNNRFRFLLSVIDIYRKYAWAIPLKNKKGITTNNAFQKFLDESNRKPNKIWVDKGSECYNSMNNKGKYIVAERFIRILKNKIYMYMTSVPKNVHIDELDDAVNKCNNSQEN